MNKDKNEIGNSNYWVIITGGLSFIFIAILFIDIATGGENVAIKILSLSGAVFCNAAVLYNDYRLKNYEGLKKRAFAVVAPIIAVLVITAVYLIFFDNYYFT